MLNKNLPHSELTKALDKYIDRINFILKEIDSEKIDIITNKILLGKLHHALNISNYKNSGFRESLLQHADKSTLEKFLYQVNRINAPITDSNIKEMIHKASRLPWKNNEETRLFIDLFGYDKNLIPKESEQIPAHEIRNSYGDPLKTLTDYQSEIFFKSMELVEIPWNRFIIKMPTGAGKTRTSMEIVCHFLNDEHKHNFQQVVWIADREELCEQAISSLKHVWPHVGKKNIHIYRLWGSRRHDKFENPSFIVATYQTLRSLVKNKSLLLKPDLIVTDEAHNVLARTHNFVLDELSKNQTRIIGLTATPIQTTDINSNKLRDFFRDEIIEINSAEENVITYLQKKGYLAHCVSKSIPSHREYRLTKEQRKQIELENNLPNGLLDTIAKDDKRNIIIAEHLLQLYKEKKQVLYFAPSVEQSKFMSMILLAKGASVAHIDATTPIEYRRDVISKFRDKTITFIFNFDVFTTGFDAPNIDVVFIARPTKSIVLHQQMIGRGMRGPKMGGTDQFHLYRILDTMPEIDLADEYFTNFWKHSDTDV